MYYRERGSVTLYIYAIWIVSEVKRFLLQYSSVSKWKMVKLRKRMQKTLGD